MREALSQKEWSASDVVHFDPGPASTEEMSDVFNESHWDLHTVKFVYEAVSPDFVKCFLIVEKCGDEAMAFSIVGMELV